MRLTVIIPTLAMGGAEKVCVLQAAALAARGHEITVITLNATPDFYALDTAVKRMELNIKPSGVNLIKKLFNFLRVRRALKESKAQVIISHMSPGAALAARTLGIPVIFAEHTRLKDQALGLIKRCALNTVNAVVVLAPEDKTFFEQNFKTLCRVIYNPAVKPLLQRDVRPEFFDKPFNALALGRMSHEKGFDKLLEAWALVAAKMPEWGLTIAGAGPEAAALLALRAKLGLENSVTFPGAQGSPAAAYKYCDIFIMPSRREGFPMVLCEAMATGAPAIAFDCDFGPRIIIRDGIDGMLVKDGDINALSTAIYILASDLDKRAALAARAPEVLDRFGIDKYINAYEELINIVK